MTLHRLDSETEERKPEPTLASAVGKSLFDSRTILLTGEINSDLAEKVCAQLLALSHTSQAPITLIVSSPGGHVESGDMIHDMIRFVRPTVRVVGTGWVASAGALIYIAAERENRFCLPNTRFMLHGPSGGIGGKASDIEIQAEELVKMRRRLNALFAKATGKSIEQIERDTERDFWLSAERAVEYGLAGKIIATMDELG